MTDEHDELTGIFDHLTADDFKEARGPNFGEDAFAKWVQARIAEVRTAWAASNGRLSPITTIADSHTSVLLPAKVGETLEQYKGRLQQEGRRLGATWLFTAQKTQVGSYTAKRDDEEIPDAIGTTEEVMARANEHGVTMVEGIYFFAIRREGEDIERKHGMIATENGRLGETVMGDADVQSASFFRDYLA